MKSRFLKFWSAFLTTAKGSVYQEVSMAMDLALAAVMLVLLLALIGAAVPYGPAILASDYLPRSVGTFLAYQCLAGPTCDFYSLLSGLALSIYLSVGNMVMLVLLVWRMMDWQDAEAEVEAEDEAALEAEGQRATTNGRRPVSLSGG